MPALRSWLNIPKGSHFSLANIPFGIISTPLSPKPRVAIAVGDQALDLEIFVANNGFSALSIIQPHQHVFSEPTLNAFAALGRPIHSVVRKYIQDIFLENTPHPDLLKDNAALQTAALVPLDKIKNHIPFKIGDYTDFFVGLNHAFNAGQMFRGPMLALNPNYKHLPVGYHGRASSVVVSGTPIRRPSGQFLENPAAEIKKPIFSASRKLDFELELGAFVCKDTKLGEPIPVDEADQSIFGVVMMNDWSARDIQAWEYVPLGPFNAKNFGTSISPWVVLYEALEPFLTKGLQNDEEILPYMKSERNETVPDIKLRVDIECESSSGTKGTICETSGKNLLFSFPQMLAHHTVGGCPFNVGDLLGSGTISGTTPGSLGCLLESTQNGKLTMKLSGGDERTFLHDGDEIIFTGVCGSDEDALVGFGQCRGKIEPALKFPF
ncbi:hypothetical protein IWZ03DRAFT_335721 [Phyllosticta citriasiana]|uniref:Fumarylacetoacetase n=1 Tax=Phyllosticta citriasiana TaxID=595635 RepID=A0ABR1KGL7_9PEZI